MIECPVGKCKFKIDTPRGLNADMDSLLRMWHHVVNNHKIEEMKNDV